MNFCNKLVYRINCEHYQLKLQTLPTQNSIYKIRFAKMLNFCWTCFFSFIIIIILNTFINPFNNGDLKEFSWNHTMKRFNCVAAMFSQHSAEAKQNFPMDACTCSTHHKSEEQELFICQLQIRKEEVWNN